MESWTGARRDFAVKSFYKNNDSYVAAQREFRKKFEIHQNCKVPSAHAIKTWVNNFKRPAHLLRWKVVVLKQFAPHRTLILWEHHSKKNPRRSAVRHSKKLGLSESSVRRILHFDLHCGYRRRFQESRSTCYLGPRVVFTIGLLSVSSVMEGILRM